MNLILFESAELSRPLPRHDPRARHVLTVLRRGLGEAFDAGIVNGPRGRATLLALSEESLTLTFSPESDAPPPEPLTLILGLPRPQTARDLLRDATTLGAGVLHFVLTERGEPSYAQSSLWTSGEWRRHLMAGAEQAFTTRIPEVTHGRTLAEAVASLAPGFSRIALDNYESPTPLSTCPFERDRPVALALGNERGWGPTDRTVLRAGGFGFHHLGSRVLRTETACTAALAIVRAKLGLM